ncbi:hypothetical protein QF032_000016 [Streptomyces achromogenes]|nr:hypothetical protein [Streptomyces achromogenes]
MPDPVPAPAADPGDANPAATSPAAPVDDDQAVGLREAHERHLPDITIAALRYARANDRTFPKPVDKRGAELLYRVGDLKKWARNRPRAASGTRATFHGARPDRPGSASACEAPAPLRAITRRRKSPREAPGPTALGGRWYSRNARRTTKWCSLACLRSSSDRQRGLPC